MLTQVDHDKWKHIRTLITAGFTSGKLKNMTSTMLDTCNVLTTHLDSLISSKDGTFNALKLYSNFACDIVCSSFFGINIDTINNPEHLLPINLAKLFGGDLMTKWQIILFVLFPKFTTFLMNLKLLDIIPADSIKYLIDLSEQIIGERRSGSKVRHDFIQHMVDHEETNAAHSSFAKTLTNGEILSQSILFMMVGTDTTAVTLSWVTHNLALYPECQDKLIDEIDSVLEKFDSKVTYEAMQEMHYMNDVIAETQRMYTIEFNDREAREDYEFNGIKVKKGQYVVILLNNMAHDESIFPEADKFRPGRNREFDGFLPFGSGPRTCIAQRFALLEIKLLLSSILSKFRFERCEQTLVNINYFVFVFEIVFEIIELIFFCLFRIRLKLMDLNL